MISAAVTLFPVFIGFFESDHLGVTYLPIYMLMYFYIVIVIYRYTKKSTCLRMCSGVFWISGTIEFYFYNPKNSLTNHLQKGRLDLFNYSFYRVADTGDRGELLKDRVEFFELRFD